jgi:hypothetical protein
MKETDRDTIFGSLGNLSGPLTLLLFPVEVVIVETGESILVLRISAVLKKSQKMSNAQGNVATLGSLKNRTHSWNSLMITRAEGNSQ